jgi:UDP-2,3-diacylglucosamine hydrolase
VNDAAAISWLEASNAKTMIHGHTHKPATHYLGEDFARVVMADWDLKATPNRAEVLQLSTTGLQRIKVN